MSKRILEKELQCPVNHFCYPSGSYTADTADFVREAGYMTAVTTRRGFVELGDDPYTLHRIPITYRTYPPSFIYKLHSDYEKRKGS